MTAKATVLYVDPKSGTENAAPNGTDTTVFVPVPIFIATTDRLDEEAGFENVTLRLVPALKMMYRAPTFLMVSVRDMLGL